MEDLPLLEVDLPALVPGQEGPLPLEQVLELKAMVTTSMCSRRIPFLMTTPTSMMTWATWIMVSKLTVFCLLRLMSTTHRKAPAARRDRRESLLLLSLECWWRVRLGLRGQQVSQDLRVLLAHQAVLEM